MFPVIGIERWYSIESPFETTKNLQRVNYLNGKFLYKSAFNSCLKTINNSKASFVLNLIFSTGCSWILGLFLAFMTIFFFPSTSLSIYCQDTDIDYIEAGKIFQKIYFITFPLGMIAVVITGNKYTTTNQKKVSEPTYNI